MTDFNWIFLLLRRMMLYFDHICLTKLFLDCFLFLLAFLWLDSTEWQQLLCMHTADSELGWYEWQLPNISTLAVHRAGDRRNSCCWNWYCSRYVGSRNFCYTFFIHMLIFIIVWERRDWKLYVQLVATCTRIRWVKFYYSCRWCWSGSFVGRVQWLYLIII